MQMPRQQVLIIGASAYSYEDRKTGKQKEGSEIDFIWSVELNPKAAKETPGNLKRGYKPQTQRFEYTNISQFEIFPGIYECEVEMQDARDSFGNDIQKPVITSVEFVSAVKLVQDKPEPKVGK